MRRAHRALPNRHRRYVDDAVGTLLLQTMSPQQITVALAAADEGADRQVRTHRAAELAVERARYEADRAERAFAQVEPENRLVARALESRWEAKLTALAEAEAALMTARTVKPPLPDHDALRALAAGPPPLWDAPTTSPRDRKRLLRTLIADVTLLLQQDSASYNRTRRRCGSACGGTPELPMS
jgi:hypothetical protein